jgi:adenine-specific DNA-methyltransferase
MIKQVIKSNESVSVNDDQIVMLKEKFPGCFAKDGSFDIEKFQQCMSSRVKITNEGYGLHFLGKTYARYISQLETETVIKPDTVHNKKKENAVSENIYISGDNLDALKHMLKSYERSVKCIYIDPPYNTGSDEFVYKDNFKLTPEILIEKLSASKEQAQRIIDLTTRNSSSHSAWLMFMYPRLILARSLLKGDGVIFISIDDNEQANLKLLCDDVFGEENFEATLTWEKRTKCQNTDTSKDMVQQKTEYILLYKKTDNKMRYKLQKVSDKKYPMKDENGIYREKILEQMSALGMRGRETMVYPVCGIMPDKNKQWKIGIDQKNDYEKRGDVFIKSNKVYFKIRPDDEDNSVYAPFWSHFLDKEAYGTAETGKSELSKILGTDKHGFETVKPSALIKNLIDHLKDSENSIILDFFSGSATTAQAVMELNVEAEETGKDPNHKYIMVQIPDLVKSGNEAEKAGFKTIDAIGMARIEKAAEKIRKEHPNTKVDLGFCHYTLEPVSQKTLTAIEHFESNDQSLSADNSMLKVFGKETVLETWLVRDGYGFTAVPTEIDLDGYKAYTYGRHLYLIDSDLSQKGIVELCKKYEEDDSFVPDYVAVFGYSFSMTILSALETNLKSFKDSDKNLNITFDVRY